MKNVVYDYASVSVDLPDDLANEVLDWGNINIPQDDLYSVEFGREDEIHITVLYGLHSDDSSEVRRLSDRQKPIHIELGNFTVFDSNPRYDVVVVDVVSPELHLLNETFKKSVEYTNSYSQYVPHVTVAYVKKGRGAKHSGCARFNGSKFLAEQLVFSPRHGEKERFNLC